ncbi:hypothetical protein Esti_001786 [Eimeria stiedai]
MGGRPFWGALASLGLLLHLARARGGDQPEGLREESVEPIDLRGQASSAALAFPSPRYQRPLSVFKEPQPLAEGLASFWWTEGRHLKEEHPLEEINASSVSYDYQQQQPQQEPQQPQEEEQQEETGSPSEGEQEKPLQGGEAADGEGEGVEAAGGAQAFKDLVEEQPEEEAAQAQEAIDTYELAEPTLPADVVKRVLGRINKRYERCGETARTMTAAEEDLVDKVVQRWQEAHYKPFNIENMTVSSEEQQQMLRLDSITPNVVNVYLRSLEVSRAHHTLHACMGFLICMQYTSLSAASELNLIFPSFFFLAFFAPQQAFEERHVLESDVTVLPVMKDVTHFSALTIDVIKGIQSVLFLLRWYDPFGERSERVVINATKVLQRLARARGKPGRMHAGPLTSIKHDGRDSGVLCCMIATQVAEGCNPVAFEGDALYFRKFLLLKLDFASRWKRSIEEI